MPFCTILRAFVHPQSFQFVHEIKAGRGWGRTRRGLGRPAPCFHEVPVVAGPGSRWSTRRAGSHGAAVTYWLMAWSMVAELAAIEGREGADGRTKRAAAGHGKGNPGAGLGRVTASVVLTPPTCSGARQSGPEVDPLCARDPRPQLSPAPRTLRSSPASHRVRRIPGQSNRC